MRSPKKLLDNCGGVNSINKLYVGNLDYGITDEQLAELFAQAGIKVASAVVIKDRYTGRSKGFGFVETSTDEDTKKAIEKLNGQPHQNRNLVVNEARPRQPRPFDRRGPGR